MNIFYVFITSSYKKGAYFTGYVQVPLSIHLYNNDWSYFYSVLWNMEIYGKYCKVKHNNICPECNVLPCYVQCVYYHDMRYYKTSHKKFWHFKLIILGKPLCAKPLWKRGPASVHFPRIQTHRNTCNQSDTSIFQLDNNYTGTLYVIMWWLW